MSSERHDLGSGHSYTLSYGRPADWPNDGSFFAQDEVDGDLLGILEYHPKPDGGEHCAGFVPFAGYGDHGDRPQWQVLSLDPLHLEPSILCSPDKGGCGNHGWIRDGMWVEA